MPIIENVLRQLADTGPQSLEQALRGFPELAGDPDGSAALLLLLRLEPRLCLLKDGRWALTASPPTRDERVLAAVESFFNRFPSKGVVADTIVNHVAAETGFAEAVVRSVILRCFENNGKLVLNRRKEH